MKKYNITNRFSSKAKQAMEIVIFWHKISKNFTKMTRIPSLAVCNFFAAKFILNHHAIEVFAESKLFAHKAYFSCDVYLDGIKKDIRLLKKVYNNRKKGVKNVI